MIERTDEKWSPIRNARPKGGNESSARSLGDRALHGVLASFFQILFRIAVRSLNFTRVFLDHSPRFGAGIAGDFSSDFLDLAFDFFRSTFNLILVHAISLRNVECSGCGIK